jgi:ribosome-interacting GTPase 1
VQLPHAPTHITQGILQTILSQYKIHHAEITLREDITVDELIDVIESTDKIGMARVYIPCVYVCNMIDKISIEELDLLDRIPHYVPISARDEWNLDGMLETMWDHMSLLRVYTKPKGQIPDYNEPVVLPSVDQNGNGPTCEFFCNRIHKALIKQFKCENKCFLIVVKVPPAAHYTCAHPDVWALLQVRVGVGRVRQAYPAAVW